MTTVRANDLAAALRQSRLSSDPEIKNALAHISTEIRERLASASKDSHDFFISVSDAIQHIRGQANSRLRAECLSNCCQYFYVAGSSHLALAPARQVVELASNYGTPQEKRKALNLLGILNAETGSVSEAIECYSPALEIAQQLRDVEAEAVTWINLGVALMYVSRYQEAFACFQRARLIAPSDESGMRLCRTAAGNQSDCMFRLGEYEIARKSAEYSVNDPIDPQTGAEILSRVVREQRYLLVLLELGDFNGARHRLSVARKYCHPTSPSRVSDTLALMGAQVDAYCGDSSMGIENLERLLPSAAEIPPWHQEVLASLARAYELAGQEEKALHCLQEVLRVCKTRRQEAALTQMFLIGQLKHTEWVQDGKELEEIQKRETRLQARVAKKDVLVAQVEMLERLAITADLREDESGEHGYRVGRLSALLAREIGWNDHDCLTLDLAARLHDIGKIGIPDRILLNSQELKKTEREFMCAHVLIGAELLSRSNVFQLRIAEEIARFHHEKWNGSGYPNSLRGTRIPIHARIVALADVFDAMTHGRPYERAWTTEKALARIRELRGTQFDPALTDRFLNLVHGLSTQHGDLDSFLSGSGRNASFVQARRRIREMLSFGQEQAGARVASNG
jgi:putative two-component system response regulator